MPIRNAIRQSNTPAPDDLEGLKARAKQLEDELNLIFGQIDKLELVEEEPDLGLSDPGLSEVSEDDDDAAA